MVSLANTKLIRIQKNVCFTVSKGSLWGVTAHLTWGISGKLSQLNKETTLVLVTVLYTHTHRLTALCPGLPGWAGTRRVKPIWILLKQEMSGSGISWAICKSAPRPRLITMSAPYHSVFTGGIGSRNYYFHWLCCSIGLSYCSSYLKCALHQEHFRCISYDNCRTFFCERSLLNFVLVCANCRNYSRFSCCAGKMPNQNEEEIDKSQGDVNHRRICDLRFKIRGHS